MRNSAELKAMAKKRMFPRLSPLVGAVLILAGIFFGLALIIAFIYASKLIADGVFASEEAMLDYMTSMQSAEHISLQDTIISYGFELIIGALLTTLTTGFSFVCLKVARNEDVKASDIFAVYKMNPDRIIIIYFIGFIIKTICMIPTYICDYLFPITETISFTTIGSFVVEIICFILQISVTIFMSQAFFIYLDNPEQNSVVTVKQSYDMMNRFFFRYLYLVLSFLPWYIVIFCTFGVAILWVLPFMYVTYALFYLSLKGELGTIIDTVV